MSLRVPCQARRAAHGWSVLILALSCFAGCNRSTQQQAPKIPSVSFIGWGPATYRELAADQNVLERFSKETSIHVDFIPGPESMTDRLQIYRDSLGRKSTSPDVYYMDVVWPAVLADEMQDLNLSLGQESKALLPSAVANDTVNGKLVSMPFNVELGLLYYRRDLLEKYGFHQPPATWDELEKMASRIQAGERAGGNKDFWGFVWQGAAYEGLTCDALEWQESFGGGGIVEADGTITVNNPKTVQALKQARRWIGTISPPSVTAFREQDSRNMFNAGNAVFARDWIWRQYHIPGANTALQGRVSVALLPAGPAARASTLGGQSLAISKYSQHTQEAVSFVRFLTSTDVQMNLWKLHAMLPGIRVFYDDPQYRESQPEIAKIWNELQPTIVVRPSTVSGRSYDQVSRAYFSSVHSVLTGEETAEKSLADLQQKLSSTLGTNGKLPRTASQVQ